MANDAIVDSPERLKEAFYDATWLSLNTLDETSILHYFSLSPFYSTTTITGEGINNQISTIEYRLRPGWESTPGLFIIERVVASSGSGAAPILSLYYCLDGVIYQCPDLATLLSSRVETAAYHLSKVIEKLEDAMSAETALVKQ